MPTSFRELPFSVAMSLLRLKHIYSVLCALTWMPMLSAACSRLRSRVLCRNDNNTSVETD